MGQKDKDLFEEKAKFYELKEHFKYNLKLIEDRDRELEKYDISFQGNYNSFEIFISKEKSSLIFWFLKSINGCIITTSITSHLQIFYITHVKFLLT